MIDYLRTLHPIGSAELAQRHNVYDDSERTQYIATVHYYDLCSVAYGSTPMEAIHAVIAKRNDRLATEIVPETRVAAA